MADQLNYMIEEIKNKIDLEQKLELNEECIKISIKEKKGLEQIKDKISEIFNLEKIKTQDMTYLSNARSISLLTKANNLLVSSLTNIENNYPIDIVEIDLKESWNTLGEIIGKTYIVLFTPEDIGIIKHKGILI